MNNDSRPASASGDLARMLLSSWNSGDLPRLRETMDLVALSAASSAGWESDEQERMETVMAVVEQMRTWLRSWGENDPDATRVSINLLRHLAGLDPLSQEPRAERQPETHASYRR